MSVILAAKFEGETFQIEISDELEMIFLDRDITYDETIAALGGKGSSALELQKQWTDTPESVVIENFDLSKQNIVLMVADWVEHVWPIFYKAFPNDKRTYKAISTSRKYVNSKIYLQHVEPIWHKVNSAVDKARLNDTAAYHSALASLNVIDTLLNPDHWKCAAYNASKDSLVAAAHESMRYETNIDFQRFVAHKSVAYKTESDWQIRHAMKIIEYTQGKRSNWPEIGVSPWA